MGIQLPKKPAAKNGAGLEAEQGSHPKIVVTAEMRSAVFLSLASSGGRARAKALSPERRKEIALNAGLKTKEKWKKIREEKARSAAGK